MKKMRIHYKGQVLAIVLIVMVVVSIIAIAMISRTMSDRKSTVEERSAAEANQMAEMAIDAFRGIDSDILIDTVNNELKSECGIEVGESFDTVGCEITNLADFASVVDEFNQLAGYDGLSLYADQIEATLKQECGNNAASDSSDERIHVMVEYADPDVVVEVLKDHVLSLKPIIEDATQCDASEGVNFTVTSVGGGSYASTALYANTSGGNITSILPYSYNHINAYCLTGSCAGNWISTASPHSNVIPAFSASTQIYEVRIRAIGGDITVSRQANQCTTYEDLLRISATVSCNDSTIGDAVVVPTEPTAHELFDYVLFNAQGSIEQQ